MTKQQHIVYGRHSGIPDCCIQFFIHGWDNEIKWGWEITSYARAVKASSFGYIPCPECLGTNRRVKIVDCERDCGRECRIDYQSDSEHMEVFKNRP